MQKKDNSQYNLSKEDKRQILNAGVDLDADSPTFALINGRVTEIKSTTQEGLVLLTLHKAREKYEWVRELEWKLVPKDKDEITKEAYKNDANGYFIYVSKGIKLEIPVQACFFIKLGGFKQSVHNLIVVDEGALLHVTNGCAVASYLDNGAHLGITEIYVRKGGYLTYTMIHNWAEGIEVRPRTGVKVEENGIFISNYISLRKAHLVQTSPVAYLDGKGAKVQFNSVVYAPKGAYYDVGAEVKLRAPETAAEIQSRSVSEGGIVVARGMLEALSPGVKGHLSCDGLMLKEHGKIRAVPELISHVQDASLTHEAAVGRISDEELFYLMTRGLSPNEATSLIVKGFLSIKIPSIPDTIQKSIDQTVQLLQTEDAL